MKTDSPKEIMDMIDTVRTKAALFNEAEKTPYQIHFSIGHSTYQSGHESTDAFLKRIDTAMYEDKRRKIDEGIIPDRRWSY